MTTATTPVRTDDQRLQALKRANVIRSKRKDLKSDLKAGKQSVVAIIARPPAHCQSMYVYDLLRATPKIGQVKANRLLTMCRISSSKTLGGLSVRQRTELISRIRNQWPQVAKAA